MTPEVEELPPSPLEEIDAELAATEAELGRRTNLTFTLYTNHDYEVNWHHRLVASELDRVLAGKCRRLMIFEPPQNGKSEQVSRRFPAFTFGKKPDHRIIACSYNMSLAQDMSRDVQKIMSTNEYRALFPETRLAEQRYEHDPLTGRRTHAEKRTQGQFDIVGKKGSYIAAGIDGPITGKSADIGIIDDPVKNRAEAESEVYRDRVWEWYKSAFATRQFGSHGAIIICLTRWHEDDLAGRLLKLAKENPDADQWDVITLPAIAETIQVRDPRKVGQALWPAKYPLPELKRRRAGMGEYDWSALFQQNPAPSGGGLFKEEWFAGRILDAAPAIMRTARGWDTAGTENGGDWTVGVKIGEEFWQDTNGDVLPTGRFIVLDVVRKQLGPDGVDKLIKLTADLDGMNKCAQREEKEGGSAGGAVTSARLKMMKGHNYAEVIITGSKVTRSKPFRAQCEGGNVYLLRGDWNAQYIKELCAFPTGKNDDDVDGSSTAFNSVLLEPVPEVEYYTW